MSATNRELALRRPLPAPELASPPPMPAGIRLSIPQVADDAISRPRLDRQLEAGLRRGVTVITAPPGYGKTYLVAMWTRELASRHTIAWITLEAADRDGGRFLRSLVTAVQATAAAGEAGPLAALSSLPPLSQPDEPYLLAVEDAIASLSEPLVLVLDDFHEVVGSPAEQLLQRLLKFRPPMLRVVVLARTRPRLGQARLRLGGQLQELDLADLAFDQREARALIAGADVDLSEQALEVVMQSTEGWPAALRLALPALGQTADADVLRDLLSNGHRFLDEYVAAEVLDRQPPKVRRFLLRTCVVDRVCGALADALTGEADGGRLLLDLYDSGLFLVALDEGRTWFRWHPLFAALLRKQLSAGDSDLTPRLHAVAARWFWTNGFSRAAIRHAAECGDPELATEVLGACWLDVVLAGDLTWLAGVLDALPEGVRVASPEAAVASAMVALAEGDVDLVGRLCGRALEQAATLAGGRRDAVEVMATVLRLYLDALSGNDVDDADRVRAVRLLAEAGRAGRPATRADEIRHTLLLYQLGAYETVMLRWVDGARHLQEALDRSRRLPLAHVELSCLSQFVSHDFRDGRLGRARERALQLIDQAAARGWSGYHALATAMDNLAAVSLLRGEIDVALRHLDRASAVTDPADLVNRFNVSFLRGVALRQAGRVAEARQELRQLEEMVAAWTGPQWVHGSLATAEADQLAAEGHESAALESLESAPAESKRASVTLPYPAVLGKLLVLCGRPEEAREALAPHLLDEHVPIAVGALAADAVALDALGHAEAARQSVERAVRAAASEQVFLPFLAAGEPELRILREMLELGTDLEPVVIAILARAAERVSTGKQDAYIEPLSSRELAVLRMLQGSLRNQDVAAKLYVSLNTVKTHVKNINQKLGTANRREAVAKARALGVL